MSLSNPLPATLQAVSVVTNAYEITRRVLEREPSHPQEECQQALQNFQRKLRADTLFEDKESLSLLKTFSGKLSPEREEIEGLLVLGLWATFERFLRDYLQEKGTVLRQHLQPRGFANSWCVLRTD